MNNSIFRMFFLRLFLLLSIALFCNAVLASICVNISSNHDQLVLGTNVQTNILVKDYEAIFRNDHFSDYQLFYTNNNAELANQIKKMAVNSCSAVLGLITTRECLIAGEILKKNKMIGFSPTCGHDDISKYYPYLYTETIPISTLEKRVANYINKIPDRGKIYVIYQPTNVYSKEAFVKFVKNFSQSIIEISVSADDKFDLSKLAHQKDEPITLVFFTYPLPSVKILIELSNKQLISKNVQIVGNASWDASFYLFAPIKPILENARSAVIVDLINWETVVHSAFNKMFNKSFNRSPLNIEVLNYDITSFVIKCYKESLTNDKYDADKFKYCITHTKYHGVAGTFSFGNHSSFSDRPEYLTNLLDQI